MYQNIPSYIAKHTIANNGWYGYSANLANNGGWLFHQSPFAKASGDKQKKEKWMKKSLKCLIAATASVVSAQAFAASNMENPLYMPKNREVYLKTGAAVMYKKTDDTPALQKRGLDHTEEFPVWRFTEDLGYGITDRLALIGRFGYTHDDDIDRKGMHRGRIGAMYRVLDNEQPIVWDLYSEAFLSGITPMKGSYSANGFKFDNYSNGRYGIIAGTRFGKTWDFFTLAFHAEYLQTFGNHNNKIGIDSNMTPLMNRPGVPAAAQSLTMAQLGFPDEISVNLKSQHETCAGFDTGFQITDSWSIGAGFEYYEHHDNGVKSIHTQLADLSANPMLAQLQRGVVDALLQQTKNMKDGWDEYVLKLNVANQLTDSMQLTLFTEYTFDDSHSGSQNGTDVKLETGVRFNARF